MPETTPRAVLLPGTPTPKFKLPASTGEIINSEDFSEKTVVLYFYPKADTPGCTKQACGFRDAIAAYKKLDVPVFGISPDPVKAVTRFAEKFKLNFPLLADEDHAISDKFGVWQEKSMYGRKYWGAMRTTFILSGGNIVQVIEKVKPEGHDQQVLEILQALPANP